ncbi:MAG: phosphatase PAP2 family protein [Nocardioidaceae bacterium]|nr:phosphatase PAP2 family protein [Nocardioidaceae bacterium]
MTDSNAERRPAVVIAVLALPLVLLTTLVVIGFDPLLSFDANVVRSLNESVQGTGWLRFFRFVAAISGELAVTLLLVGLAVIYAGRGRRRTALWIATVALVSAVTWPLVKRLVHRARPDVLEQIQGYSFPSGHATGIAAAMGVLVVVTVHSALRPLLRTLLVCLWLFIALLVGFDRIFVGAHNPSDVVAGWLLGSLVVCATGAAFGVTRLSLEVVAAPPPRALTQERRVLAVILNPIKIADAETFKLHFARAARAAGWDEPLWFETTVDDAGGSMARAAVAAGADLVVAAGGDGTVRVVCSEMAGSGIPVGVIPAGTGNLLARNLGIPLLPDLAIDTVLRGQDRPIDVVLIEGDSLAPTRFVVMAGLGLDAAIMGGAPDALKARLGWPAYVITGARHLRYPAVRVDISIDGGEPVRRRARTVVIGNVGSLQGGIPLLPDAVIDDGILDVVVVAPRRLSGWLSVMARVVTKRRRTDERLDRFTGTSVKITAAAATPRQLDGDTVGAGTELFAQIEPGVLLVRVPG